MEESNTVVVKGKTHKCVEITFNGKVIFRSEREIDALVSILCYALVVFLNNDRRKYDWMFVLSRNLHPDKPSGVNHPSSRSSDRGDNIGA
jgi:hypothetical protein